MLDLVAFTYHHALMPLIDAVRLPFAMTPCTGLASPPRRPCRTPWPSILPSTRWCTTRPGVLEALTIRRASSQLVRLPRATPHACSVRSLTHPSGAEMAFTERAIPTLVEAGLEWVIVSNSHISRSCQGYPFSPSGDNNDPPNKAYQTNPAQSDYFSESISRGCTPDNAYPFSYTPHYAQHVDPETGKQTKMVVVPAAQAMSWKDGYACYNTQDIQKIAAKNNPEHPMLVMLAHDGDNSFGGGYTYCTYPHVLLVL